MKDESDSFLALPHFFLFSSLEYNETTIIKMFLIEILWEQLCPGENDSLISLLSVWQVSRL